MKTHFTSSFFAGNRRRLLALLPGDALVVVTANGTLQRSGDTTFPFSQDRYFWYLTGVSAPDIILVLNRSDEYLILPPSNAVRDIFDGAIDTKVLAEQSGIQTVLPHAEGWQRLRDSVGLQTPVHTLIPGKAYEPHHMLYVNPARKRLVEKLKRMHPKLQLQDTRNQLASLRVIKQPEEVAVIQKAVNITAGTLTALSDAPGRYKHEFELEAAITSEFRRRGAAGHAYTPIVASGSHATTLHYVDNSDILQKDGLIVVDVGAEVENYAADITRTLCFGSPTARQQSVIDAVKDVQDHALSLLKPGASMRDYERNVVSVMGEALVRLGLITNPNDMAAIRHYYPHATSHFLGLDVHDVGDYSQELRAGMVLTCEPGIYIPEEGIGVRIEDDVLITDSGHTNLSADCSRECFRV